MPLSDAYLDERIAKLKEIIAAIEDAVLQVSTGAVESYDLDTGQTRQRVTKQNLKQLEESLERYLNQLSVLCARRDGSNVRTGQPWG